MRVRGLFEDIYLEGSEHYIADDDDDAELNKNDALRTLWMDWADFRDAPYGHTPTVLVREWMQKTLLARVSEDDPYEQPTEAAPAAAPSSAAAMSQKRRDRHSPPNRV